MNYTAEQLREWADNYEKTPGAGNAIPNQLRAHADLLDWKARIEAARSEDVREPIEWHRRKAADFSIAKSPAWAEEHAKTATLLESLSAKLAEREAELAKFKGAAELLYDRYEEGTSCHEYSDGQQGSYIGNAVLLTDAEESSIVALLNGGQNSPSPMQVLLARAEKAEAEVVRLKAHAEAMAEHWENDDTMDLMASAVTAYRRDYPEGTK